MNACETLIVPNCTVAPDGEFALCEYYEAGEDWAKAEDEFDVAAKLGQ